MNFYGSGLGDRLIDETIYPPEIKKFLRKEKGLLRQADPSFENLIEVGCMHGRYLQWAIKHHKNYVGIDVISSYIKMGRNRLNELKDKQLKCEFILGSAENINVLLNWKSLGTHPDKALLFFPFNSFGNMDDCMPVIKSIKKSGAKFIISTYPTTSLATTCRQKYYEACLYKGLKRIESKRGITFISEDGLSTIAYHSDFLLKAFKEEGLSVQAINFAGMGIAYSSPGMFIGKKRT